MSGYIDGLVEGDKINLKLSNTDESQYGNGGHVFKKDLAYKDPYNIGLMLPVNRNYDCSPQDNYEGDITDDVLDANFHCEFKTSRDKINLNVNKRTSVQIVFNDPACNFSNQETVSGNNNQIRTTVFSGHDFILEIKVSNSCNFETSGNKFLGGSIQNSLQTININCN